MTDFCPALPLDELEESKGCSVNLEGARVALFRIGDEVFAVEDVCPHAGSPLAHGYVDDGHVICPLHLWTFDLRTGESSDVPGTFLRTYDTRVRDGVVEVKVPASPPAGD